jgi:hypothetical protein
MRVASFSTFCHSDLNERTRIFLLQAVCAYSCDQTIIVHEGEKKKRRIAKDKDAMTPADAYGLQWDFIMVSSESPVPDLDLKRAMMAEFLVQNLYTHLNDVVKLLREHISDKTPLPTEEQYQEDVKNFISGK